MAKREFFPRIKEAREALRGRANEIIARYFSIIEKAEKAGNYEVAAKALQWLMEHLPEDEGLRIIETHVDKKQEVAQPMGPRVQIGIQVGGVPGSRKALPKPKKQLSAPVVTVEPTDDV